MDLDLLKETSRKDPVLIQLEQHIENRKLELEQKYPVKEVGLSMHLELFIQQLLTSD